MIHHDVVIVGSGIAGMRCAIEIRRQAPQVDVVLVSKQYPLRSSSVLDRGGIAAPLGNVILGSGFDVVPAGKNRANADSSESHASDTAANGGDAAAINLLASNAAQAVYELEHMGAPFSRTSEGRIAQAASVGHSNPRLAYASDRTGHAILHTLYGELVRFGIKVYPQWFMLDLLTDGRTATGISVLDMRDGSVQAINAKVVVFATGSYGRVFKTTSDAESSTGDGLAAAQRAGVELRDMANVQFHPLGLGDFGFAISERALYDGGFLLNGREERFLPRYTEHAERAPLSEISRAIASEIAEGRGAGPNADHVWLDVRHLPAQHIRTYFPHLIELARDYLGINALEAPVPVKPSAHYTLGGIPTDIDGRVEGFENFYAVGACANNGVHGSEALPGNELLAAVVFSRHAGAAIARQFREQPPVFGAIADDAEANATAEIKALLNSKGEVRIADVRERLLAAADANNGLQSLTDLREQQIGLINDLRGQFARLGLQDKGTRFNTELIDALELERLLEVSQAVASAAVLQTS